MGIKFASTAFIIISILGLTQNANAQGKSKFGVTVDECVHGDMDEYDQNFCSDSLIQSYAKIAKSTPANFDGN